MPEDRVRTEHAEVVEPGDRRLAVPRDHLVELDDRLRGVHGVGASRFVGQPLGVAKEIAGARVHLRRRDTRADEIPVRAVVLLDEARGAPEAFASRLFVPLPHDAAPVAREPPPGAERESLVHAQVVQPLLEFTALVALQLAIAQLFECINHLLCCKLALVKDDHLRSGGSRRFDKQLVIRVFIAVPVNRRRRFEHSRVTVENR